MINRRTFVRSLGLAATAVALGAPAIGRASRSAASKRPLESVRRDRDILNFPTFARLQGARFRVGPSRLPLTGARIPGQAVELDQVVDYPRTRRIEAFSLRFQGAAARPLAEGTSRFTHPQTGPVDLHVIPGERKGDRRSYRATVCRLA